MIIMVFKKRSCKFHNLDYVCKAINACALTLHQVAFRMAALIKINV